MLFQYGKQQMFVAHDFLFHQPGFQNAQAEDARTGLVEHHFVERLGLARGNAGVFTLYAVFYLVSYVFYVYVKFILQYVNRFARTFLEQAQQ